MIKDSKLICGHVVSVRCVVFLDKVFVQCRNYLCGFEECDSFG